MYDARSKDVVGGEERLVEGGAERNWGMDGKLHA